MEYPGIDGFLGTRASLAIDMVSVVMLVVVPILGWSIYQVKVHRRYVLHKSVQLGLGILLALAIAIFEIDIRVNGWSERASGGPSGQVGLAVSTVLWVHLGFAVTTALLWVFVIVQALRKIPVPPRPCAYSAAHRFWARIAAIDLVLTTLSGWLFYWLAFVN